MEIFWVSNCDTGNTSLRQNRKDLCPLERQSSNQKDNSQVQGRETEVGTSIPSGLSKLEEERRIVCNTGQTEVVI